MTVEEQHVVTVSYELREGGPAGELIERMDPNYPFHFLFGTGNLLTGFEDRLRGLKEGENFEFILQPEDAYGYPRQDHIIEIAREAFARDGVEQPGLVTKGNMVAITDDLGDHHTGKILSFDQSKVTVDFNHSMAGKTLHFSGVVLHIRPATVDELVRKHYIAESGTRRPGHDHG